MKNMSLIDSSDERNKKLAPLKILAAFLILAPFVIFLMVRLYPNPENKFFSAVNKGDVETVNKLMDRDPTLALKPDRNNMRPLHYAAKKGNVEMVRTLVRKGANVNDKDKKGYTPLHYACTKGNPETVKILLEFGADVNAKTNNNKTPLTFARSNGNREIIQMLESRGARLPQ